MAEKAVLYARVSTDRQFSEGYSIDAQLQYLRDYAIRNGLTIVQEFITSESAKAAGRKTFNEMFQYVKKFKIKNIIVEKTDRFLRNLNDNILAGELVRQYEVTIHLTKEGLRIHKNSNSHELLMFEINTVFAKNFIDRLREETKKGMLTASAQGKFMHKPPFGYQTINKQITTIPDQAAKVTRAFRLYLENIPARLLSEEIGLSYSKIYDMLKNPFYIGKFKSYGKVWQGTHNPIVDENTFYLVQAKISEKRTNKIHLKEKSTKYKYSGLIKCDKCGNVLVASPKKKGKYVYYSCSSKFRTPCGNNKDLNEKIIDSYMEHLFDNLEISDEAITRLKPLVLEYSKQQNQHVYDELKVTRSQITKINERLETLDTKWLDQQVNQEKYNELNGKLQAEKAKQLTRETALEKTNLYLNNEAYEFLFMIKNIKILLPHFSTEVGRRAVWVAFTGNFLFDGEKLSHTWSKAIDIILKMTSQNRLVAQTRESDQQEETLILWEQYITVYQEFKAQASTLLAA